MCDKQACDKQCEGVFSPGGGWKSPLCDLAGEPGGCERCAYTHLCFCLAAGEVAEKTGGSWLVDCCLASTLGCLYFSYCFCWGCTRSRLRAQQGIPGSLCCDFVTTLLCPPCYLAQALNHLDLSASAAALSGPRRSESAAIPTDVRPFSGAGRRLSAGGGGGGGGSAASGSAK